METEVLRLSGGKGDTEKIRAAAKILDNGALVAFPTETVYGIGCAAEAEAIERLNEVKGRVAGKRYTVHIAEPKDVAKYVPVMPARGRKLIETGWPGPLTAVFELDEETVKKQRISTEKGGFGDFEILYADNTIGIRCPDNAIARQLLGFCSKAIVAPSANLAGQEPATSAEEVLERFDGQIDMIVAPGEGLAACGYEKPSTVVEISGSELSILRAGAYSKEQIAAMACVTILFVCTGNTCRSPMAEGFCRKYISKKLDGGIDEIERFGYKIISAGVVGGGNMPASDEAINICGQNGIDLTSHRSRMLECGDIEASDYIFAMSPRHCERVLQLCPAAAEKCVLLDAGGEVGDPIGGGDEVYRTCAEQISRALEKRMDEILI